MPRAAALAALVLLAGCTTERLPLCPLTAEISYPKGEGHGKVVNAYTARAAAGSAITILPLSPYAAQFRGNYLIMKRFVADYPQMLCAFDPRQTAHDKETYVSCMSHAPEWIAITQSGKPEDLALEATKFRENCTPVGP